MSSFAEARQWFAVQPFVTKWLVVASLVIPVSMQFKLLPVWWLVWDWPSITRRFQLWRAISSCLISAVNFNYLFSLYYRFQYTYNLETGKFYGRSADLLYFLLFSTLLINLFNWWTRMAVLWEALNMAIVYLWAQYNKDAIVSFMFGIRFPAIYLPAVLFAMDALLMMDIYSPIMGIIAGHAYYFLVEVYPQSNPAWRNAMSAPRWMRSLVPQYKSADAVTGQQGFTVHRPSNPLNASQMASSEFKPFSGKSKRVGKD